MAMTSKKTEAQEKAKKLLDPILSVFAGEDGGIAFAKMRHTVLPEILEKEGNQKADDFILMVTQFSRFCEMMLE